MKLNIYLGVFLIALMGYTLVTVSNHGLGLVPIFFADMAAMTWPGQFNFDFFGFLLTSGLWTAWRNGFTPKAFGLGLLAVFFGMLWVCGYGLYLSHKTGGDLKQMLLGVHA